MELKQLTERQEFLAGRIAETKCRMFDLETERKAIEQELFNIYGMMQATMSIIDEFKKLDPKSKKDKEMDDKRKMFEEMNAEDAKRLAATLPRATLVEGPVDTAPTPDTTIIPPATFADEATRIAYESGMARAAQAKTYQD